VKKIFTTLDELLEKDLKLKKKFNKEFKKYQNRPKPNKKLKIGLKYIKKYFNLKLFLKRIENYNYKYMDEGTMLHRIINYGFEADEVTKIWDHLDGTEFDNLHKLAEDNKLLPKITDNFKINDALGINILTEEVDKWIRTTLLYSKINSTYYWFIDEYNYKKDLFGNCLYLKSKNEKTIWNKMFKFIQKTEKENKPSRSANIK
jgi:hypothetical protein|tara:strand:- start:50 stop:658 length:609 start_codon:yes stop_codon:yes gene_type:complete